MKVLILTIVPSPYQRDLFRAMANRPELERFEVWYAEAASPDSPWPEVELEDYETVGRSFWISLGGKRFIVNREFPDTSWADLIVLNGYITLPAQWLLRRKKWQKFLFWAERMEPPKGGLKGVLQKFLTKPLNKVDAVVAIGEGAERDYENRFRDKPVYQLPYYCDIDNFRVDVPERPRNPVRLFFCGQMIHRKGVDVLLQAFEGLVLKDLPVELILVGREGELPEMLEKVGDAAKSKIDYKGFQAPEALPMFYREADVFVLPSRYDGWGVVVNQALGAGLPAVCSDAVGSAETLVKPGSNGAIFPAGDAAALEQVLEKLVRNPDFLRKYAADSLERGVELRPQAGAARWVEIFRKTMEG